MSGDLAYARCAALAHVSKRWTSIVVTLWKDSVVIGFRV